MENILFFHLNEINPQKGGISKATFNLSKNFELHGHNVWFVASKRIFEEEDFSNQLYLPISANLCCKENEDYLCRIVTEKNISVIINQCPIYPPSVELLAKVKSSSGVKIVSCFHNSILTPLYNFAYQKEYFLKKKHLNIIFNLLNTPVAVKVLLGLYKIKHTKEYKRVIDNSDAVVLLNDGLVKELKVLTGLNDATKLHSIPNACNTSPKAKTIAKSKTVLWVGTFDIATKRPDIMIDAWSRISKQHPDWTLKLLGDGGGFNEMKRLAKLLNVGNIVFKGRVDPTPYYQEASIVAVTSTHESFSLVTLEALQYGCVPVVINSFPAASLIIENGINGVLIDSFNSSCFEKVICCLMSDNDLLLKLSAKSNYTMYKFDRNLIYKQWINLIKTLS